MLAEPSEYYVSVAKYLHTLLNSSKNDTNSEIYVLKAGIFYKAHLSLSHPYLEKLTYMLLVPLPGICGQAQSLSPYS